MISVQPAWKTDCVGVVSDTKWKIMVNVVCMMVIIIKLHRVVVLSVFSSSWSVELQKATVGLFPSLRKPKPPCRPLGIYAQFGLIVNRLSSHWTAGVSRWPVCIDFCLRWWPAVCLCFAKWGCLLVTLTMQWITTVVPTASLLWFAHCHHPGVVPYDYVRVLPLCDPV